MITTPDAIDIIFGRDEHHGWVNDFTLRGRTYTVIPGGPATFDAKGALVRVYGNCRQDVRIRPTDAVEVVSRRSPSGKIYPEGSAPWSE